MFILFILLLIFLLFILLCFLKLKSKNLELLDNSYKINSMNNIKKIHIINPSPIKTLDNILIEYFKRLRITASISKKFSKQVNKNIFYFILFPQLIQIPKGINYCIYQLEQLNANYNLKDSYFKKIKSTSYVFDYSIANINFIGNKNIFMPIPIILSKNIFNQNFNSKILFFGSMNKLRKDKLKILQKNFNIQIVSNIMGEKLYSLIKESDIIINIHYYDYKKSLLEVFRFNEILQFNKIIISEKACAEDSFNYNLYKDLVIFIDNIEQMIETINYYLNPKNYQNYILKRKPHLLKFEKYVFEKFSKCIYGLALIKYNQSNIIPLKYNNLNNIYCLSLDETYEYRYKFFINQSFLPKNIIRFSGIKYPKGIIGCGLSYQYLIGWAKKMNMEYIIICEDDTLFPPDFSEKLEIILEYLSTIEWNLFIGISADISKSKIYTMQKFKDFDFFVLNSSVSTVFNIYHKSVYDTILKWDKKITIDRYLENSKFLKFVITNPFLVDIMDVQSTIFNNNNIYNDYQQLFSQTRKLLKQYKNNYLKKLN